MWGGCGRGASASPIAHRVPAISAGAWRASSQSCRPGPPSSSAPIFPQSRPLTSPRRSRRSAGMRRSSVRRRMAAIGWSDFGADRACLTAFSQACAGRANTRSPIRWRDCRATCRSRDSRRWTISTTSPPIGAGSIAGSGLEMLLEPRHQLDEIAGAVAIVELVLDDVFPAVAAGAGRAGKREEICAARDAGRGAALDRRGADLLVAEPAKELAEARDLLLIDRVKRLGRHVAPGDARAAGRDHDIDGGIGDPGAKLRDDGLSLVLDDAPLCDAMAGGRNEIGQGLPGFVVGFLARV